MSLQWWGRHVSSKIYAAALACSLQGASETLTFGRVHVLLPQPDTLDHEMDMDKNESAMAALCQVNLPCFAWTQSISGSAWPELVCFYGPKGGHVPIGPAWRCLKTLLTALVPTEPALLTQDQVSVFCCCLSTVAASARWPALLGVGPYVPGKVWESCSSATVTMQRATSACAQALAFSGELGSQIL